MSKNTQTIKLCDRELIVTLTPIESRSQNFDSFSKTALHFRFEIALAGSKAAPLTGEYSCGFGHAETWAKKNRNYFPHGRHSTRDFLINPLPYGKRHSDDSQYVRDVREIAMKYFRPDAMDVLQSCVMDASGSDQDFSDWASDYGYSDDSISAKNIWEICNDTRRALDRILSAEAWEQLRAMDY